MSNRARRIVAMAKNLNSNELEEVNELHEQENDLKVTNLSDLTNKTSFLELNLEQLLNPEDIADIINNAKVVFESTLKPGIIKSDKSSSEQVVDSEIQDQSKRIISDPSFEIKDAEDSLDQYVTKSSTNHMILEENKQSDPDYDATMRASGKHRKGKYHKRLVI